MKQFSAGEASKTKDSICDKKTTTYHNKQHQDKLKWDATKQNKYNRQNNCSNYYCISSYLSICVFDGWYVTFPKSALNKSQHEWAFTNTAGSKNHNSVIIALLGHFQIFLIYFEWQKNEVILQHLVYACASAAFGTLLCETVKGALNFEIKLFFLTIKH